MIRSTFINYILGQKALKKKKEEEKKERREEEEKFSVAISQISIHKPPFRYSFHNKGIKVTFKPTMKILTQKKKKGEDFFIFFGRKNENNFSKISYIRV